MTYILIPKRLYLRDIIDVAYGRAKVKLSKTAIDRLKLARSYIDKMVAEGRVVYGVNTGVGALASQIISADEANLLQKKLLLSHATGFGDFLENEIVRAAMFIRANMLSRGYSGVRPEIIVLFCALLNEHISPLVPQFGSVGASGDLAPLAHIGLSLVGSRYGMARAGDKILKGSELKKHLYDIYRRYLEDFYRSYDYEGEFSKIINPDALYDEETNLVSLSYKEGIALINGTDVETGLLALVLNKTKHVIEWSKYALCLTMEASRGIITAFDPKAIRLLNNNYAYRFAKEIQEILQGSKLVVDPQRHFRLSELISRLRIEESNIYLEIPLQRLILYGIDFNKLFRVLQSKLYQYNAEVYISISKDSAIFLIRNIDDASIIKETLFHYYEVGYVQDAYSIRCTPKIYGIVYKFLDFAEEVVLREANSITDNPIIICDEKQCYVYSSGHFHGQPLAFIADSLSIALSCISGLSERRIFRLLDPNLNRSLPPFLIKETGVDSGLMITQYTASALQSMNSLLSHSVSVYSTPTSANQEDWNSMGMNAALKLNILLDNIKRIVATEILCASQAIMLRTNGDLSLLGAGTRRLLEKILQHLNLPYRGDYYFKRDIDTIERFMDTMTPT